MKWIFKKKPMAIEVVDAVFALLTEDELNFLCDPNKRFYERDIRKIVLGFTPNKRARYSMKKSLKIAEEEIGRILFLPVYSARRQFLALFGKKLFKF